MYEVRCERDSISPAGVRLTSFVISFPRVCLAEVVTHRLNSETWNTEGISYCERPVTHEESKNSASSRAISLARFVEKIKYDPYMPMWTLQQKGMQGAAVTDEHIKELLDNHWLDARNLMIGQAQLMHALGAHKQDCNRLLEPWQWVTQIVTSSRWDNFFALRCHEAAFPPFRKIARMMYLSRQASTPRQLDYGHWHLPFTPIDEQMNFKHYPGPLLRENPDDFPIEIKRSAARCAWISYENHDRQAGDDAVLRTYGKLFEELPVHASPVEHQATPFHPAVQSCRPELHSNLRGWIQARKLVRMECIDDCRFTDEQIAKWDDVKDYTPA